MESVGCKVIFLLPYSLDLNPIEKFWDNMKMWIRNQITQFSKFYESIITSFYSSNLIINDYS
ncbi:transposase [Orientia tsutsugamushi]